MMAPVHTKTGTQIFAAAFFVTAARRKQRRCVSGAEWVDERPCILTAGHYRPGMNGAVPQIHETLTPKADGDW